MWHSVDENPKVPDIYIVAWVADGFKMPYPHFYEMVEYIGDGEWDYSKIIRDTHYANVTIIAWCELPPFYTGD